MSGIVGGIFSESSVGFGKPVFFRMEVVRRGKTCSLLKWDRCFAEDIHLAGNNPNVAQGVMAIPIPFTLENAKEWIELRLQNDWRSFAICVEEESKWIAVGSCGARTNEDEKISHIVKLGYSVHHLKSRYWLSERYWNRGIGTDAISLLIDYVTSSEFEKRIASKVERIEAEIFPENISSERVLLKNGFELECYQKKAVRKNNQIRDLKVFVRFP